MKKLRSGYTTGACAAAAAKAAATVLLSGEHISKITIPFPDDSRVTFDIVRTALRGNEAQADVIKDAGDDPDVTNKAVISATVHATPPAIYDGDEQIRISGGHGVGTVTRPGLPVAVGQPAINPVPLEMITEAVKEAISEARQPVNSRIDVIISVPQVKELAEKTLNKRLGIVGGISILGTTGIVKPLSAEAWTATISSCMNVASAAGIKEIILSTGRSSEKCVQVHLGFSDVALVMMGDYLEFALKQTHGHNYRRIHMATMWAKLLKGAMKIPQTHVRHGALEIPAIIDFFREHGIPDHLLAALEDANTAREVLDRLLDLEETELVRWTCRQAKDYYESLAELPVSIHLVHGSGRLLCTV
ncbi:MAG: cobalt-precorrin-5B (C(1))-methyltransferase CbiD [Desulfocapsaceae bacterium]|jgi:cobalt-precorrin-5B (C1)-methyltransferase|nr:cobalt-precorrin-5B (C(1))-methyltransferase CbiD [Desulfocapsaceae bacterium]